MHDEPALILSEPMHGRSYFFFSSHRVPKKIIILLEYEQTGHDKNKQFRLVVWLQIYS